MDKSKAQRIDAALKQAVAAIEKEFDVKFELHGGKFNSLSYIPRLTIKETKIADGKDAGRAEFEKYAAMIGLKSDWYGMQIRWRKGVYTVSGIDIRRPKYCVRAKDMSGKEMLFSAETVIMQLSR
jgi:hypothetical protein